MSKMDLDRMVRKLVEEEESVGGNRQDHYVAESEEFYDSDDEEFSDTDPLCYDDDNECHFINGITKKDMEEEDDDDDSEVLWIRIGIPILAVLILLVLLVCAFVGCRDKWSAFSAPAEEPDTKYAETDPTEPKEEPDTKYAETDSTEAENTGDDSVSRNDISNSEKSSEDLEESDVVIDSRKPIKVKVIINNIETEYGMPLMTLSYEVKGAQKDTLSKYIVLTKESGNDVGTYNITGTCTAPNLYDVTFIIGKYTIIPRKVILQADNKESVVGEALKPLTYTTVSGSIVKGDKVVNLSTSADPKKAGTYDIVGKCTNTNYNLTVRVGKYTVKVKSSSSSSETKPIDVAVKISDKSSYYGDKIVDLDFSVTKGEVKKEELSKYITLTKAAGKNVGNYKITGKCTDTGKYNVTFTNGTYTIKGRKLSVSIDNKESLVGDKLATLTYSVKSGSVVAGDKCIELSTNADPAKAGTYDIVGKCINSNYNATIENKGVYTVKEKEVQVVAVTVQIENKTSTYGDSIVGLDFSVVDGDVTKAEIAPYITLTKEGDNNVGSHKISGSCSDNGKYNVTFVEGTYTITQRSISVKIDDKQTYEGDALDELTYSVTSGNEVNGDKAIYLSTSAKPESIGEYTIDVSFNANYAVQIESGGTYRVKAKPQLPEDKDEEVEKPSDGPQDDDDEVEPNQPTPSEPEEASECEEVVQPTISTP